MAKRPKHLAPRSVRLTHRPTTAVKQPVEQKFMELLTDEQFARIAPRGLSTSPTFEYVLPLPFKAEMEKAIGLKGSAREEYLNNYLLPELERRKAALNQDEIESTPPHLPRLTSEPPVSAIADKRKTVKHKSDLVAKVRTLKDRHPKWTLKECCEKVLASYYPANEPDYPVEQLRNLASKKKLPAR